MSDINLPEDRKRRFAGDRFSKYYQAPSEEFLKKKREIRTKATERAVREGYRDNVEKERGKEWYDKALNLGLDHATKGGAYTGGEVRAEMRYGRGDKSVEEMREYYQGLIDDGVKFNGNARDFLADKHGLIFPDSGGGETNPDNPETSTGSGGVAQTVRGNIGAGAGAYLSPTMNVNQDNDITNTISGNNNSVTNNQDNSITQTTIDNSNNSRYYGGSNRYFSYGVGKPVAPEGNPYDVDPQTPMPSQSISKVNEDDFLSNFLKGRFADKTFMGTL